MTPFDCASLSLNGSELRPPTVGGSPLTSGGHVAASPADRFAGCASDMLPPATMTKAAMSGTATRKVSSSRLHTPFGQRGKAPGRSRAISAQRASAPGGTARPPGRFGNGAGVFAIETERADMFGWQGLLEQ